MMADAALHLRAARWWQRLSLTCVAFWNAVILLSLSFAGPAIGSVAVALLAVTIYCMVSPIGFPLILTMISFVGSIGTIDDNTAHLVKWAISLFFLATAFIRHSLEHSGWSGGLGRIERLLLLFLLWGVVCSVVGARPMDGIVEVARMSMFVLVYFVTLHTVTSTQHVTILTSAVWFAVVASSLYSFSEIMRQGFFRVAGFLGNANAYGLFLTFALPLVAIGAVVHRRRAVSFIFWIGLAIGSVSLLLSWSRTAILALGVQVITYLIIEKHRKALTWMAALGIVAILFAAMSPTVRTTFSTIMRLKSGATHRPILWSTGLSAVGENPVLGMGFNVQKQDVVGKIMWSDFANYELFLGIDTAFKPHNAYIYVALATGLTGLLIFVIFYWKAFAEQRQDYRSSRSPGERRVHAMMLSVLVGTLAHGLFESASILAAGSSANYFWIMWGVVAAIKSRNLLASA
jgi:O-antigen ligase